MKHTFSKLCLAVATLASAASVAQADLLVTLSENPADGTTVIELDGSINTLPDIRMDMIAEKTIVTKTDIPPFTTQWVLGEDEFSNAFAVSQRPDGGSSEYTVARLTSATDINDLDFPAFDKATFDPLLEIMGGDGFILSVKGSQLYFELIQVLADDAAPPAPQSISTRDFMFSTATFENQTVQTTIPFSGFTSGQSIEFGDFGGEEGDGARIQIGVTAVLTGPSSRPDLLIGAKPQRLRGDNVYSKRKASRRQTVKKKGFIAQAHKAIVHLRIQNDGTTRDRIKFSAEVDLADGTNTSVFAYPGGRRKVITAQAKSGKYFTSLEPGESEKILYRISTSRLWAGARSDRKNDVDFTARSGPLRDKARLELIFRE